MLGKFLPEADQPDGGVFAFRNEDDEWVALRLRPDRAALALTWP